MRFRLLTVVIVVETTNIVYSYYNHFFGELQVLFEKANDMDDLNITEEMAVEKVLQDVIEGNFSSFKRITDLALAGDEAAKLLSKQIALAIMRHLDSLVIQNKTNT